MIFHVFGDSRPQKTKQHTLNPRPFICYNHKRSRSSGSYTYVDPDQQRYFFEEIFCLPSEQGSIVAVEKYSKESITTQTNMHGCSYGYLSDARRAIAKANPVIKAKKLYKIYNFFILAFKVVVRNTQKVE
ncbi:hypothetical protein HS088_TW14G00566 [Tripterygium wilfordii]|uniref:Uncharacterized protein n=1 Tax=Tripterygium wilfordii TaxID=458696 RepID=A0A7J7CQU8_TRIWF|nr:hypothetical protein HS088_TW14G00566 [Tripterygium wilfordii]